MHVHRGTQGADQAHLTLSHFRCSPLQFEKPKSGESKVKWRKWLLVESDVMEQEIVTTSVQEVRSRWRLWVGLEGNVWKQK